CINIPFFLSRFVWVASSNYSQHCSKAVLKAIKSLWQESSSNKQVITSDRIHNLISQTNHSSKRYGAAATLAMILGLVNDDNSIKIRITHVGDSRVYHLPKDSIQWQCLTRDHNLLNELVDQQAHEQGRNAEFTDYNHKGMASSLYNITECFALDTDGAHPSSEAPNSSVQTVIVNSGDCLLVCTDGIHDLVSSKHWQLINAKTDLQEWLKTLKDQVYDSEGNAYDNGTAILVRFS
ncbi:MAG: protein phosphatase 2C domain-containing protein, partial [Psychrobacter sp.]|nr:protein phosphatase 2C domain-containing protein [Psychrobacter sp.]